MKFKYLPILAFLFVFAACSKKDTKNAETEGEHKTDKGADKADKLQNKQKQNRKKAKTRKKVKNKAPKKKLKGKYQALIKTSMGDIKVELNADKAPISVDNFIKYAKSEHYDNTIFHRVMATFMIQGGGFKVDKTKKTETLRDPITNEAKNGLSNLKGTIAMARTTDPHSVMAQFFINVVDNQRLDYQNPRKYGYAVFGKVIKGMDVVEKIKNVKVTNKGGAFMHLPVEDVIIKTVVISKPDSNNDDKAKTAEKDKQKSEDKTKKK
ncbi:MAG: peptidylprolyl isomerase [Myxococcota bacterium]